jgi:hypothetical protein
MQKFYRWLVMTIIGLLALPAMAQESAEPRLELVRLRNEQTLESAISAQVPTELFFFVGKEGDSITVTMMQDESSLAVLGTMLDPYLLILGPAGQVLAFNDDMAEGTLNAQVADLVLPADGPYLVFATSLANLRAEGIMQGEEAWPYTITLEGSTAPEDEASFSLLGSTLTFGTPFNGTITPEEPVYYFFFNGEAGDVIDLTLTSEDFDTVLYLFSGKTGARVAFNDDSEGSFNSALIDFELPTTTRYLVFATYYGFANFDPEAEWQPGDGRFTILVTKKN